MKFFGNVSVALGDTVYIPFVTDTSNNNVGASPSAGPSSAVYTPANFAAQGSTITTVTNSAVSGVTGGYVANFVASSGNGFSRGQYMLRTNWTSGGNVQYGWAEIRIY